MLKRLGIALFTICTSLILTFLVIQLMPGDPVETMVQAIIQTESIPIEMARERAKSTLNYDPDVPLATRFVKYATGIITGNLGESMVYRKPVSKIVFDALPWTLLIVSASLLLSFAIGVLMGVYIAWKRKRSLNTALAVYQSVFGVVPEYIIAYILIIIFAVKLEWLPSRGAYSSSVTPGFNAAFILNVIKHSVLPVMSNFIVAVAGWTMSMKANSLSVLGEDYITYAKARGLSERRIITSYVGRNAILPVITSLAISFGAFFGGSPLLEGLFLYPGVGLYLSGALTARDYPLMQGMFFLIIVTVVLSVLLAEYIYIRINPRLRER